MIKRAFVGDKEQIMEFIENDFQRNWKHEVEHALMQELSKCFIATEKGTPDGDEGADEEEIPDTPRTTTITETVLVIELTHKTPAEMAITYAYTPRQQQYLELLTDPQNDALWLELLGGFTTSSGEILTPGGDWGGNGTLQWPLPIAGSITSPFGCRTDPISGATSYHGGTDIAAPNDTPILAAADGIVVIANGIDS